jgi:anti-sigma factor RsiW
MNGPDFDRFRQLLTRALDDELAPGEREEFDRLLAASSERQAEWAAQKQLKEATMKLKFAEPPPEVWDGYWTGVYRRLERGIGWILVSLGAMVLLFYGGYELVDEILADRHLPILIKTAILAALAGGTILFVSVLREKLFTRKTDKYREIQR